MYWNTASMSSPEEKDTRNKDFDSTINQLLDAIVLRRS